MVKYSQRAANAVTSEHKDGFESFETGGNIRVLWFYCGRAWLSQEPGRDVLGDTPGSAGTE